MQLNSDVNFTGPWRFYLQTEVFFFSAEIKPNYRTNIWAKSEGLKYLASATDDPYTVNYLQFNEKKTGRGGGGGGRDCRLIRFQDQCSSRLQLPGRFDKS